MNKCDGYFNTLLYIAIEYGRLHFVESLVKHGTDVNIQGGYFKMPIVTCCKYDRLNELKFLHNNGIKL